MDEGGWKWIKRIKMDECASPYISLHPLASCILHFASCILLYRGAKLAAAKPIASKARQHCRLCICSYVGWLWQILNTGSETSRITYPRQTIADQGRPWQTKEFWYPRCYQHLRCLYWMNISSNWIQQISKSCRKKLNWSLSENRTMT